MAKLLFFSTCQIGIGEYFCLKDSGFPSCGGYTKPPCSSYKVSIESFRMNQGPSCSRYVHYEQPIPFLITTTRILGALPEGFLALGSGPSPHDKLLKETRRESFVESIESNALGAALTIFVVGLSLLFTCSLVGLRAAKFDAFNACIL